MLHASKFFRTLIGRRKSFRTGMASISAMPRMAGMASILSALLLLTCVQASPVHAMSNESATVRMNAEVPSAGNSTTPAARFGTSGSASTADNLDDYDAMPGQGISDPLEPWNRFWFGFNDIFYLHIARPVYQGYAWAMPNEFQSGIKNFFSNLLFPMRFVNFLLQGNPKAAGVEFGRFFVNTTVGFGGFIDAAKGRKAIVPVNPADGNLGQTLGVWGIGPGFYMVWPFLGPNNTRDTVGMVGDWLLDPSFYVQPWYASWGSAIGFRLNELDTVLPLYENIKDVAVDPYISMREAFAAYRKQQIIHGTR